MNTNPEHLLIQFRAAHGAVQRDALMAEAMIEHRLLTDADLFGFGFTNTEVRLHARPAMVLVARGGLEPKASPYQPSTKGISEIIARQLQKAGVPEHVYTDNGPAFRRPGGAA